MSGDSSDSNSSEEEAAAVVVDFVAVVVVLPSTLSGSREVSMVDIFSFVALTGEVGPAREQSQDASFIAIVFSCWLTVGIGLDLQRFLCYHRSKNLESTNVEAA